MKYIIKGTDSNLYFQEDCCLSSDKNDAKVFSKQIDANEVCWDLRDMGFNGMVVKK